VDNKKTEERANFAVALIFQGSARGPRAGEAGPASQIFRATSMTLLMTSFHTRNKDCFGGGRRNQQASGLCSPELQNHARPM
jgi:hypothetical protein